MSPSVPSPNGVPRLIGRTGSLDAFWPLIEVILTDLQPRRCCEIGVDQGIFTDRLMSWGAANNCAYIGIDPAPDPAAAARIGATANATLLAARSVDALRELVACEAYFVDGDHNYHTVVAELDLIAAAGGPLVFAHDVSWPWARRDMYHCVADIPPEARQPHAEGLGVSLDEPGLIEGGLRSDRYAIAQLPGGPRNGVLTGIEAFLASETGQGWRLIVLPMAFGLGIIYRPNAIPIRCRGRLEKLADAVATLAGFLESSEANFLRLYLYGEEITAQADALRPLVKAYADLEKSYGTLDGAYRALSQHSDCLLAEYNTLLGLYHELDQAFKARG